MDIEVGKRYRAKCEDTPEETVLVTGIVGPGLYEGEFYVTLEDNGGFPGIMERREFVREL